MAENSEPDTESDTSESANETLVSPLSRRREEYIEHTLIKFIIHGLHPYRIVAEEDFKAFIMRCGYYVLPSQSYLSRSIKQMYNKKKQEITHIIQKQRNKISLSIGSWTSVTSKTYIIVTAHFIANKDELISITLEFDYVPFPNDNDQVLSKIKKVIEDFDLKEKLISITTHPSVSNTIDALLLHKEYKNVVHIECLVHVLQNVVNIGLKVVQDYILPIQNIVKFIGYSRKNKKHYKKCCRILSIKWLPLVKDSPTRWNSTYLMLQRALQMKSVLDYMCTTYTDIAPYTIDNWENVKNLVEFLEPFYEATTVLMPTQKREPNNYYPSLCYVVPILDILFEHLRCYEGKNKMKNCAIAMMVKLNEYYNTMKTDLAQIATVLDPRLNNHYFVSKGYNEDVVNKLRNLHPKANEQNEMEKISTENVIGMDLDERSNGTDLIAPQRTSLFASIYKKSETFDDIDTYISMPSEPENTDVILWWTKQKTNTRISTLIPLAYDILPIPATSVPSNEAFTIEGDIKTKTINRLGCNHIQTSICLSSWLKTIDIVKDNS